VNAQKKTSSKLTIFILLTWAVIALLVWAFRGIQMDDAYITYRYARNVALGLGFSYNPPQFVLGTTTPLYTLILAMCAWIGLDIPLVSLVLNVLGLAVVTWVLTIYRTDDRYTPETFLPAALLIILPGTYLILGMETALYTAFIYLGIYFLSQKKFTAAIIFASLVTLTRYDGIVVAGIILVAEWYFTKSLPLKNCIIYIGMLIPWILYATLTFGSVLPNTFFAKTGNLGNNAFIENLGPHMTALFTFAQADPSSGYVAFLAVIIFLSWSWIATKNIFVRVASFWGMAYLVAYSVLGLRYSFHWYYYPVIPVLLISVMVNTRWLQTRLEIVAGKTRFAILIEQLPLLLIVLPMFILAITGTVSLYQQRERLASIGGRNIVYPVAGKWVCAHSDPQATILTPEIGIIGWNCDRTISITTQG
jgi:hypothetical protein